MLEQSLVSAWEVMPSALKSQELFQGQDSQALRYADRYSSYLSPAPYHHVLSTAHGIPQDQGHGHRINLLVITGRAALYFFFTMSHEVFYKCTVVT